MEPRIIQENHWEKKARREKSFMKDQSPNDVASRPEGNSNFNGGKRGDVSVVLNKKENYTEKRRKRISYPKRRERGNVRALCRR